MVCLVLLSESAALELAYAWNDSDGCFNSRYAVFLAH
jgi:hypothetical protein